MPLPSTPNKLGTTVLYQCVHDAHDDLHGTRQQWYYHPAVPEIIELPPMNRMRRRFLRLLISSTFPMQQGANLDPGYTPPPRLHAAINSFTDSELLQEWYRMHVSHTDPQPPRRRLENFRKRLEECARMMAIEAILYSEEELRVLSDIRRVQGAGRHIEEDAIAEAALRAATERRRVAAQANVNAIEENAIADAALRAATERLKGAAKANVNATATLKIATDRLAKAHAAETPETPPKHLSPAATTRAESTEELDEAVHDLPVHD